ncbi:MAG: HisA/HisF-related TIM barrel protein, partial [Dehalococcoidia bacterium]|nr:HisA/HisF-related TIM barrel protein [Dehalococcoidia bacterium]
LEALLAGVRASGGDTRVIYSGGVSSLDHIRRLAETGVEGVIVGRALYSGDIDLREALAAV